MATNRYVDVNLATGANNGTSEANAYNTADGIKDAVDEFDGSTVFDVWVKPGPYIITETIPLDAGGVAAADNIGNRIIGCDSNWNEISSKGTWIDVNANGGAFPVVTATGTVNRVRWKHFHFHGTDGASPNDAMSLGGVSSTSYGMRFVNCKFSDAYRPIDFPSSNCRSVGFIDCEFINEAGANRFADIQSCVGGRFYRCYFKGAASNVYAVRFNDASGSVHHCVFDAGGEGYAARFDGSYGWDIMNCAFLNFATAGIYLNRGGLIANNIIQGLAPAADQDVIVSATTTNTIIENNISTNVGSQGHLLTDHEDPLYGVSTNKQGSTGDFRNNDGTVNGDYRWNKESESVSGFVDDYGNASEIGVSNTKSLGGRYRVRYDP